MATAETRRKFELFLLRHAKAEARGPAYPDDSRRPLSQEGIDRQWAVSKGIRAMGIDFDVILSSPFARAKQTAEIVAEVYRTDKLDFSDHLAAGGDSRQLIAQLAELSPKRILLVGHEPDLSRLISRLTTGEEELQLNFKKSGLCKLTVEALRFGRCATLEWLLTPKQILG